MRLATASAAGDEGCCLGTDSGGGGATAAATDVVVLVADADGFKLSRSALSLLTLSPIGDLLLLGLDVEELALPINK